MIEAVFFDLDQTLLDNDGDQFLEDFTAFVGERLEVAQDTFAQATMVAGAAMMGRHPEATNHDVMLRALVEQLGLPSEAVDDAMRHFQPGDMDRLGWPWRRLPEARRTVLAVLDLGPKTVLATSPIYLEAPIRERMRRANVDNLPWTLVTTSDRMHSAKPHVEYFLEAAAAIGCRPEACLMVGDNPFQDLPARKAGLHTYYVGQPIPGLDAGPSGRLEGLVPWMLTRLQTA